ncbi:MAG TPA: carbon storage regulator [Bryobacteraceae bacterium]|nr:carbon storage regulator [Bryobacteraceae bacterium]
MMMRRAGEAIRIGDDVEIHIARIGRSRVKLAIDAPREVRVVAREVQVVEDQNRAAAAAAGLFARARQKNGQVPAPSADMEIEVDPGHPRRRGTRARQDAG